MRKSAYKTKMHFPQIQPRFIHRRITAEYTECLSTNEQLSSRMKVNVSEIRTASTKNCLSSPLEKLYLGPEFPFQTIKSTF